MTRLVLALDFGGTKLSAAVFGAETSRPDETQRASSLRSWRPSRSLREAIFQPLNYEHADSAVRAPMDVRHITQLITFAAIGSPPHESFERIFLFIVSGNTHCQ